MVQYIRRIILGGCCMISASAVYRIIKEFVPNFLESYESDYSTRLKVQKIIYLFEQFIDDDSYGFSWYLAGPYSSVLTHQVYSEIVSASKDTLNTWDSLSFNPEAIKKISRIQEFLNKSTDINSTLNFEQRLELLASVWYIAKKNFSLDEIKSKLLLNKPYFSNTDGLNNLVQLVITTKGALCDI